MEARHIAPREDALTPLWQNWNIVLDDLSERVFPMGAKQKTLLLGVEDNMEMQEMRMEYNSILDRVNSFMLYTGEKKYFDKLEFSLLRGRTPMKGENVLPEISRSATLYVHPSRRPDLISGSLLEKLYEAYTAHFERASCDRHS